MSQMRRGAGWPSSDSVRDHWPLFVLAAARLCSSLFFCWPLFFPAHLPLLICPPSVVLAGPRAHSYPSLLIYARLHSFAGPWLFPPVYVRSDVLGSTGRGSHGES